MGHDICPVADMALRECLGEETELCKRNGLAVENGIND